MAELAPAPVDPPAAKPKKKSVPKTARSRSSPTVQDQIVKIVAASQERKGMSTALLKKQLIAGGYDADKNKARIRLALKSLVKKGTLMQMSGTGASGSFKIAKKTGEAKTKKSSTASKATPAKKSAPKAKTMKKVKSPKKAKASSAAKKKASPKKKTTKKVSKPAPAKKATPVKSKKAAPPKSPKVKKQAAIKKAPAKKASKPKVKKTAAKK
ncbi:histone H1.5-like [Nelusetta ayraudi]|uniref:histone H1.5-like n=1 Tax=Nelusetta ayraudi TaxID=303726 RepID=UPI003F72111C